MANGKIPLSAGQVIGSHKSVPITKGNSVVVTSLQIPSSGYKWLVLSRMDIDFSTTGTMNNELIDDNVIAASSRTIQTNGGGCMAYAIVDPGSFIQARCYITAGSGNASATLQAIRI